MLAKSAFPPLHLTSAEKGSAIGLLPSHIPAFLSTYHIGRVSREKSVDSTLAPAARK